MSINDRKLSIFALCRAERKGKADKTSRPRRDLCAALMAEWRVIYVRLELLPRRRTPTTGSDGRYGGKQPKYERGVSAERLVGRDEISACSEKRKYQDESKAQSGDPGEEIDA